MQESSFSFLAIDERLNAREFIRIKLFRIEQCGDEARGAVVEKCGEQPAQRALAGFSCEASGSYTYRLPSRSCRRWPLVTSTASSARTAE